MFLDDTACNLASLNLMTFLDEDGEFEVEDSGTGGGAHDPRPGDHRRSADYPTPAIAKNSHLFRPLGLGYTPNLGAL